jgi:hypothetical protein
MAGTAAPLPALFGPEPVSDGIPVAVKIGGLQFEWQGEGFGYKNADVNVYLETAVDANGFPVQGQFQVIENVFQLAGNVSPDVGGPMGWPRGWNFCR